MRPCAAGRHMNAMDRESGDQNGCSAPSVPASGCATLPSIGRTHSLDVAPRLRADDDEPTGVGRHGEPCGRVLRRREMNVARHDDRNVDRGRVAGR